MALLIATNCLLLGLAKWGLTFCLPLDGTSWTFYGMRFFSNLCDGMLTAHFFSSGSGAASLPERLVVRLVTGILLGGLFLGMYALFFGWLATANL